MKCGYSCRLFCPHTHRVFSRHCTGSRVQGEQRLPRSSHSPSSPFHLTSHCHSHLRKVTKNKGRWKRKRAGGGSEAFSFSLSLFPVTSHRQREKERWVRRRGRTNGSLSKKDGCLLFHNISLFPPIDLFSHGEHKNKMFLKVSTPLCFLCPYISSNFPLSPHYVPPTLRPVHPALVTSTAKLPRHPIVP